MEISREKRKNPGIHGSTPMASQKMPRRGERHFLGSGVSIFYAGHWPPSIFLAGGIFRRAYCKLSRPVYPWLGCSWLRLLPGVFLRLL